MLLKLGDNGAFHDFLKSERLEMGLKLSKLDSFIQKMNQRF